MMAARVPRYTVRPLGAAVEWEQRFYDDWLPAVEMAQRLARSTACDYGVYDRITCDLFSVLYDGSNHAYDQ